MYMWDLELSRGDRPQHLGQGTLGTSLQPGVPCGSASSGQHCWYARTMHRTRITQLAPQSPYVTCAALQTGLFIIHPEYICSTCLNTPRIRRAGPCDPRKDSLTHLFRCVVQRVVHWTLVGTLRCSHVSEKSACSKRSGIRRGLGMPIADPPLEPDSRS